MSAPSMQWLMERVIDIGPVQLGLPGLISLCMFLNPLVEAISKIRRDRMVGKLPLLPYSAMVAAGMIWTTYGWLNGNTSLVICNSVSVIFGLYYCWVYCTFCPVGADWLPYKREVHFGGMIVAGVWSLVLLSWSESFVLGISGNVLCVVMFGGPLAAVKTVIAESNTRSLPFGFTCVVTLNGGAWMIYSLAFLHDPMVFCPNCIGFLLGLAQLSLFARYGFDEARPQIVFQEIPSSNAELEFADALGAPDTMCIERES